MRNSKWNLPQEDQKEAIRYNIQEYVWLPKDIPIIIEEYKIGPYSMISGGPTEGLKFNKYMGDSGNLWLVGDCEDPASHIYVEDKNPKSQGFGGRTLRFPIVDGSERRLQGPWNSNPISLYEDTGIDFRNQILSFGVIGFSRISEGSVTTIYDVIYVDEGPTRGTYKRIEDKAQELANRLQCELIYFSRTREGSTCGPVKPNKRN